MGGWAKEGPAGSRLGSAPPAVLPSSVALIQIGHRVLHSIALAGRFLAIVMKCTFLCTLQQLRRHHRQPHRPPYLLRCSSFSPSVLPAPVLGDHLMVFLSLVGNSKQAKPDRGVGPPGSPTGLPPHPAGFEVEPSRLTTPAPSLLLNIQAGPQLPPLLAIAAVPFLTSSEGSTSCISPPRSESGTTQQSPLGPRANRTP